ncbi:MYCBP-associated protein-like [Salarias fasciatus]|uniref:MYCBP-associated protein-like n=1 Tax=Salarias fasciatus TaxID=181472 RepID=UPI0011769C79|nr:MYCBP-associated protein-like [Salarias fasciatus]
MDSDSEPATCTGLQRLRFDSQGMLLPHCILGSLEDFRSCLEARGETDLVKRIPKSVSDSLSEITERPRSKTLRDRNVPGHRNRETNALNHWDTHMEHRRRQQSRLSGLLDRPVEHLLMNQANHFREAQEEKQLLSQALPLIQSGYGCRVGSEFWSLPQRYGDEVSGITATLTQTELGRRKAVTRVGQPNRVRQESGLQCGDSLDPVSQTQGRRSYLQQQFQQLGELLSDTNKPDVSGLQVIGSGKPLITACQSRSVEREVKEKELKDKAEEKQIDSLTDDHDVQSEPLCIPALRFSGQLATWTGNSATKQGEVGISSTVTFETLTGEIDISYLELQNEGSTVVYFNWQKLPRKPSFCILPSRTKKSPFYFDSSPGVISPGDTHLLEIIFTSEEAGIKAECWQLNTHPLLLQGASIQVTLRGVALPRDQTKDQRLFIESKLEEVVVVKMCQSIVDEVMLGVQSPERPASPEELYITEEQRFLIQNPKLQFVHEPVQNLKRLWDEASQGPSWDLSVDSLRLAVLSLPDEEPSENSLTREEGLARVNALLLQLSESSDLKHHHLSASVIGQQLMGRLLEEMADEATRLRSLLGLPQSETWTERNDQPVACDADSNKDEESKERESGTRSTLKDDNKGKSKPSIVDKCFEGRKREEVGKSSRAKLGSESGVPADACSEIYSEPAPDVNPELKLIYTRLLHKKVYALMEDLLDCLCDLLDGVNAGDEADAGQLHEILPLTSNV